MHSLPLRVSVIVHLVPFILDEQINTIILDLRLIDNYWLLIAVSVFCLLHKCMGHVNIHLTFYDMSSTMFYNISMDSKLSVCIELLFLCGDISVPVPQS